MSRFVKLTTQTDDEVWVNVARIDYFRADEWKEGIGSLVAFSGRHLFVRESPDTIARLLNGSV